MKWTAKAFVFPASSAKAEHTLQLYQTSHSEDKTTAKEDLTLALFGEKTLMKNHDASVERNTEKRTADLMNYLRSNGRGDDAKWAPTVQVPCIVKEETECR